MQCVDEQNKVPCLRISVAYIITDFSACKPTKYATASRAIWDSVFKECCKTLDFPPLINLAKLQVTLQRDNLQAPDYLLAIQIVLFTIANLPATANTLRHRLPTILLALPLRYIVSISNFAVPYLFKTVQRYKQYLERASISAKIFVFLTFVFFKSDI